MEPARGAEALREGWRAMERADWDGARQAFETTLAAGEDARALDGLGQALWFLGRVQDGIAARERAFAAYLAAADCEGAARMAVWLSHQHLVAGRASAARGWLARAERSLERAGAECAGHGWLAAERARHATTAEEQAAHARRAMEIARAAGAGDLEVFALSLLGRAEVSAGRCEQGMVLLEEAMTAASAGQARNLHTLAEAYCNLIMACAGAGEWERAAEWCAQVDEFARTHATAPLFGACRTVHADVLLARGRWPEAEQALEAALVTHERFIPQMGAPTVASLAELRVRQGRLAEAQRLLAGREEHPSSLRALALLRLAEDRPQVAVALLERGLAATADHAVRASQLLAPLVDAQLSCGNAEAAAEAVSRLRELAASTGIALIGGRAELAASRLAHAQGRPHDAAEPARRALEAFGRLAMPLEASEARLELARALAGTVPELAREEARVAHEVLRSLGAVRAADGAAAVLRDLGAAPAAARPRTGGELTGREQEVLDLVGRGLSNAQIAQALFISEKTAGHHVSRILMKLGVRNRAEAAACAARSAAARAIDTS